MEKEKKKMDEGFSFARCSLHEKQIENNKEEIDKLKTIVKGDNNGTKGHAMRIHDLESSMDDFLEGEKRRKTTLNAITVAVSIQIIIIVVRDYIMPILKIVK